MSCPWGLLQEPRVPLKLPETVNSGWIIKNLPVAIAPFIVMAPRNMLKTTESCHQPKSVAVCAANVKAEPLVHSPCEACMAVSKAEMRCG